MTHNVGRVMIVTVKNGKHHHCLKILGMKMILMVKPGGEIASPQKGRLPRCRNGIYGIAPYRFAS